MQCTPVGCSTSGALSGVGWNGVIVSECSDGAVQWVGECLVERSG